MDGRYDTLRTLRRNKGIPVGALAKPVDPPIPMSLSNDQVRRLARLARIAIRPEEDEAAIEGLNRVIGLIDELLAVDTAGIEPMAHPLDAQLPQGQRLRADAVTEGDGRELYQSVAPRLPDGKPAAREGLYLVPKVIE